MEITFSKADMLALSSLINTLCALNTELLGVRPECTSIINKMERTRSKFLARWDQIIADHNKESPHTQDFIAELFRLIRAKPAFRSEKAALARRCSRAAVFASEILNNCLMHIAAAESQPTVQPLHLRPH